MRSSSGLKGCAAQQQGHLWPRTWIPKCDTAAAAAAAACRHSPSRAWQVHVPLDSWITIHESLPLRHSSQGSCSASSLEAEQPICPLTCHGAQGAWSLSCCRPSGCSQVQSKCGVNGGAGGCIARASLYRAQAARHPGAASGGGWDAVSAAACLRAARNLRCRGHGTRGLGLCKPTKSTARDLAPGSPLGSLSLFDLLRKCQRCAVRSLRPLGPPQPAPAWTLAGLAGLCCPLSAVCAQVGCGTYHSCNTVCSPGARQHSGGEGAQRAGRAAHGAASLLIACLLWGPVQRYQALPKRSYIVTRCWVGGQGAWRGPAATRNTTIFGGLGEYQTGGERRARITACKQ